MNVYQKRTVYLSIGALTFFLGLSIMTHNWKFFLWSLLPVFMILMPSFTTKTDKNGSNRN